ncbi:hypothetical protein FRZ61_17650 [Hypericibacter adhaerens]|uniref:Uncharacterized protein n=1 Tax=Hypericibacter adhaerens TaxID=2602016 RepID=A0A5J6N4J9_9PROT|nr:hypothetical protein [Hypericibacter adhaerens]QEX21836.1 hypothetical protein FRZ61_17650 [Hypericibacter adhaerens]
MSLARDIIDRVFFPNRDVHAIPVLDGGFSPNQRLEQAEVLASFEAPDSLALGPDGRLYVSAGPAIHACSGSRLDKPEIFARAEAPVSALRWTGDGRLLAAVDGRGLHAFDRGGKLVARLDALGGVPLRCVTAIAVAADGTVYATDGSRHNEAAQWLTDLMQNRRGSGRLIAAASDLSNPRLVKDGLSWPAGVAIGHDEKEVLVGEAWAHGLSAVSRADGSVRRLVRNFVGYPGRICRSAKGGYWVAFFALRTQLTEFILREPIFRMKMMEQVPPDLWIGPTLGGKFDYREPTQIGRIKKLGIQKPWAPPRSYGLVARLDEQGQALESLHSRVSGNLHGITDVAEIGTTLYAVSKGHGKVASVALTPAAGGRA